MRYADAYISVFGVEEHPAACSNECYIIVFCFILNKLPHPKDEDKIALLLKSIHHTNEIEI